VGLVHLEITPPSNFHHLRDTTIPRRRKLSKSSSRNICTGGLRLMD
jgi:hypothetical protein